MIRVVFTCVLFGMLGCALSHGETCPDDERPDDRVYTFGFITTLPPYKHLNKHGELVGSDVSILRHICKTMNKKCETVVTDTFGPCWDGDNNGLGLQNRWFDACVGVAQTPVRKTVFGFLAEYAREPPNYFYVLPGSDISTVDDIRSNGVIGLIFSWWISEDCVRKFLASAMENRIRKVYTSPEDMVEALEKNEINVVLMTGRVGDSDSRLQRVNTEPLRCSDAGFSFMMRKDEVDNMRWLETGLQKLRDNGDLQWICNIHSSGEEPECI